MPQPYRRHAHAPKDYVSTVALAAETGWHVDRVRRVARQHSLVIAVLTDLFVHREGFLALLQPRPVPPTPAPSPDQAA
jgi:hypothetical protein